MTVMKIKKQNKIKNKRKKIWMIFTKKRILKTKNLIMIMKDIKMKCFINRNKEKNKNLMKIIILNRIMRNLNNNTKISTSTNRIRKMIGIIYINKKKTGNNEEQYDHFGDVDYDFSDNYDYSDEKYDDIHEYDDCGYDQYDY